MHNHKSQSTSIGMSTSGFGLSIPVYGAGSVSGSVSNAQQKSNSNYQSVFQQSGIAAGDGGFDIKVSGNTDLKGAAITSTAAASDNHLVTQTLSTSDLQNSSQASASSSGISLGTDMLAGKYAVAKSVMGNALNRGQVDSSDNSTTHSVISAAQVTVGNKTTDTSQAELKDSQGKTVTTDTSNAHRALQKADVAGLQELAQEKQADKVLLMKTLSTLADGINKKEIEPKKLFTKACASTECVVKEISPKEADELVASGKVKRISNNGMFNNEQLAIENAKQQTPRDGSLAIVVVNPAINNVISEGLWAVWKKAEETFNFGSSSAGDANRQLLDAAETGGNKLDFANHSAANFTFQDTLRTYTNKNQTTNAINTVTMFGTPVNAEKQANTVNDVTRDNQPHVQYSVHVDDKVGTLPLTGNNKPTGGVPGQSLLDAHGNYTDGLPDAGSSMRNRTDKAWGEGKYSKPVVVLPNNIYFDNKVRVLK